MGGAHGLENEPVSLIRSESTVTQGLEIQWQNCSEQLLPFLTQKRQFISFTDFFLDLELMP